MDPFLVASATDKGLVILLLAVVVGPLLGVILRVVNGDGWERIGKGPLAMEERRAPELDSKPDQIAAEVRELENLVGSDRGPRP